MIKIATIGQWLKRHALPLVLGSIASVVLGVGAWWTYMEYRPVDPTTTVHTALVKQLSSQANMHKLVLAYDYTDGMKANITLEARITSNAAYVNLTFGAETGFIGYTMDVKGIVTEDGLYVKAGNPAMVAAMLAQYGGLDEQQATIITGNIQNKWLFISYNEITANETLKPFMNCVGSLQGFSITPQDKNTMLDELKKQSFMKVGGRLADEHISGKSSHHFALEFADPQTLLEADTATSSTSDPCKEFNAQMEAFNKASEAESNISGVIENASGEVWIDKFSGEMTKVSIKLANKDFSCTVTHESKYQELTASPLPLGDEVIDLDEALNTIGGVQLR